MKRLFFTTLLSGFGAAIGLQVFVWQSPWLIQKEGGFYISQGIPYAATGAVSGVLIGEALTLLLMSGESRKAKQRLNSAVTNEAVLQGLTLDQQAVLLEALRRMEQGDKS
ncbi:MAG: hypothetical protein KME15_26405 [Drouetiella hepatica Uher 2000/2452]|jgi:hypothetical protein|uniref:Uncharacterized protein n=1 Tax=Drouetiella hepatica Uher 2000/2452 TaxID=904376 RepID=A0A951QG72_9CYAN|nr:hypothetical protein [Drouetiella hepatica Uher 2000/2452]